MEYGQEHLVYLSRGLTVLISHILKNYNDDNDIYRKISKFNKMI